MFNLAKKWGYLKENPTEEVTCLKVNDCKPPRFLTTEGCQRLLKHSPDHLYPIFFTFLTTGMRKAELENLEWTDVNLERERSGFSGKSTGNLRQASVTYQSTRSLSNC